MGFREDAADMRATMDALRAVIERGGYACLGCLTPTRNEGQVCDECAGRGVRVENDTVSVEIGLDLPDWMTT